MNTETSSNSKKGVKKTKRVKKTYEKNDDFTKTCDEILRSQTTARGRTMIKNGIDALTSIKSETINNVNTIDLLYIPDLLTTILHYDRIRIIDLITSSEEKLTVTDIYTKLREEQSVISQQLAILREAGVLEVEQDGKYVFYSLNNEMWELILKIIKLKKTIQ